MSIGARRVHVLNVGKPLCDWQKSFRFNDIVILFNILDDRIGNSDCFKLVVYGIFRHFVDST